MPGAGFFRRVLWLACATALLFAAPVTQLQADALSVPRLGRALDVRAAHGTAVDKDAPADDADDGLDSLLLVHPSAVPVEPLVPAPPLWQHRHSEDDSAALTSRLAFSRSGPRAPPTSTDR